MKTLKQLTLICILFTNTTSAFSQEVEVLWSHYLTERVSDAISDFLIVEDGIILVGEKYDTTHYCDFWVTKYSFEGNLIWEKTFGGSHADGALSVNKLSNGQIMILGESRSSDWVLPESTNYFKSVSMVLDSIGNEISIETYPLGYYYKMEKLRDNNFILIGSYNSIILDDNLNTLDSIEYKESNFKGFEDLENHYLFYNDYLAVQIDKTTKIIDTIFQTEEYESRTQKPIKGFKQLENDEYIVVGYTHKKNLTDAFIKRLNIDGSLIWKKYIGKRSWDFFHGVEIVNDDLYVVLANLWLPVTCKKMVDGASSQQIVLFNGKGKIKSIKYLPFNIGTPSFISEVKDNIFYVIGKGDLMKPYLMKCKLVL